MKLHAFADLKCMNAYVFVRNASRGMPQTSWPECRPLAMAVKLRVLSLKYECCIGDMSHESMNALFGSECRQVNANAILDK